MEQDLTFEKYDTQKAKKALIYSLSAAGIALATTGVALGITLSSPSIYNFSVIFDGIMPDKYTVTEVVSGGGDVKKGQRVELVAKDIAGYRFDGWYFNDKKVSEKLTYIFDSAASREGVYEARYEAYVQSLEMKTEKVVMTDSDDPDDLFETDEEATITLKENYRLTRLYYCKDNDTEIVEEISFKPGKDARSYTFLVPPCYDQATKQIYPIDIYAEFEPISIEIQSNNTDLGTVQPSTSVYQEGHTLTMEATPIGESKFLGWQDELGTIVSNEASFTVTMQHDMTAKYTAVFYVADREFDDGNFAYRLYQGANRATLLGLSVTGDNAIVDGRLEIPESVEVDGVQYSVYRIWGEAFTNGAGKESDGIYDARLEEIHTVVLPASLEILGGGAFFQSNVTSVDFSNCTKLRTVEDAVFYECKNLSGSIVLPKSVTTVEQAAFYGCSSVTSINFGGAKYLGAAVCFDCTSLSTVVLQKTVETIGVDAFCNCTNLQGEIHLTAKIIGERAFDGCQNADFTFENIETIGDYAFESSGVTNLVLPDTIQTVGYRAFAICQKLESVAIKGSGVIAEGAFSPYGEYGTERVTALKRVDISASIIKNYSFSNNQNLSEIILREGITEIGEYAFACTAITSIEIPSTVKSIGAIAFVACEKLESIVLNEGLESIGYHAFAGCALTSVTLPKSLKSIVGNAFGDELSLENIYYNGTLEEWKQIEFIPGLGGDYDDIIISSPIVVAQNFYVYDGESYVLVDKNLI